MSHRRAFVPAIVSLFLAACGEPSPGASAAPAASDVPRAASVAPLVSSAPAASVGASAMPSAVTSPLAPPAPADPLAGAPALFDADQKPLGQTEDRPSTSSPAFEHRMQLLWKAIVANDATIAEPVFFPVVAYEQVKDIKKPAADWKSRLMKAFSRDIRKHHEKLGAEAPACKLLGVDVDEARVKWMKPGKEGNKLGYHRVTRSTIRYADPAGEVKKLPLTSLISWRGEWFVVHLDGFE